MDRLTPDHPPARNPLKIAAAALFLLVLVSLLAVKAKQDGWFAQRQTLRLNNQPAVLFFNRHKGCECELLVYEAADAQVKNWPADARLGVPVVWIELDQQRELGIQYKVIRAPTLLLLDHDGQVVFKQDNTVDDLEPLNLALFEQAIQQLFE